MMIQKTTNQVTLYLASTAGYSRRQCLLLICLTMMNIPDRVLNSGKNMF